MISPQGTAAVGTQLGPIQRHAIIIRLIRLQPSGSLLYQRMTVYYAESLISDAFPKVASLVYSVIETACANRAQLAAACAVVGLQQLSVTRSTQWINKAILCYEYVIQCQAAAASSQKRCVHMQATILWLTTAAYQIRIWRSGQSARRTPVCCHSRRWQQQHIVCLHQQSMTLACTSFRMP